MGFFTRLKWLLTGAGEAPASFKPTSTAPHRRNDSETHSRHSSQGNRDRHPRDRGERGPRHSRDGRDRDRPPRANFQNRDGNDRFQDRDQNQHGRRPGSSQGGYSRRDSSAGRDFPRPIERPSGGPSSTMRPAQSSVPEAVAAPTPRVESQGPEKVGVVTHYYNQAHVASIKIEHGQLRSGDWIEIQGSISSLRQKVDSMQLDSQPIQEAHENQEVGIRVIRPVKAGDTIVRLRG